MTERELQDAVAGMARALRWKVVHHRPARTATGWRTAWQFDGKGFPDLLLVRDRVVLAEIKAGRGRLSPEQEAWLEALLAAGAEAYVWREEDWLTGIVEAALRRVAAP